MPRIFTDLQYTVCLYATGSFLYEEPGDQGERREREIDIERERERERERDSKRERERERENEKV